MKNFFSLIFLLALVNISSAQTISIVNTPGISPNIVVGELNYHVSESIYTETEIGASNFISAATSIDHINFMVGTVGINTSVSNYNIYMKNIALATTTVANGTYSTAGYTLVFSGIYTPNIAGWVGLALATPFTRISGKNLEVLIVRTDNVLHTGYVFDAATGNKVNNVVDQNALSSRRYNSGTAPSGTSVLTASNFRPAIQLVHAYAIDAQVKSIINPYTSCFSSSQNILVVLKNAGTNTIAANTASVTLKVRGANSFTATKKNSSILTYGSEETISFTGINLSNIGASTDTAYVSLTGDNSKSNDTLTSAILTSSTISSFPAIENVEGSLPVFPNTATVAKGQYWGIQTGNYNNPDLSGNLSPHSGNAFYLFDSYDALEGTISRLFSNCLDFPSGGSLYNLSFWMSHDNSFSSALDSIYVTISVDHGQSWTRIAGFKRYDASFSLPGWKMQTLNLSAYAGETIQIGFDGVGAFGNSIGIDDITITASGALPVTLLDFNAKKNGAINNITWSTSQEINTSHFIIERSNDGFSFQDIGKVTAAGSSNSISKYEFNDKAPLSGINYYRLRTVDKNMIATLSIIRSIKNPGTAFLSVYPNPVAEIMHAEINALRSDRAFIIITDVNGKQVYNSQENVSEGSNVLNIDMTDLSAGIYIMKIKLSDNIILKKFIKQ